MLRLFIPLSVAVLLVTSSVLPTEPPQNDRFYFDTVNAVLGDVSYTEKFGNTPDEFTSEQTRIKTHLEYVINLLEEASADHLSYEQKINRSQLISLLEEYKETGQFPRNHHFKNRQPVFIDKDGNLCAVGYLIAQTEGLEAAQRINQEHKFDYIKDIEPHLIDGWLAENGITKKEAAMIQPTYKIEETIKENDIETAYLASSSLLAGIQIGGVAFTLLSDTPSSMNQKVYALNAATGLISMTLGIVNLDNTYTVSTEPSNEFCGVCYYKTTTYKNPARTKFSIANIVIGGLSAAFNGFRFFQAEKQEDPSKLNISATQVYDPNSNTVAPGISMSVKF